MDESSINVQSGAAPLIPPNDMEAEQAVLSSMLFDNEVIGTAYETLFAEDFYRPQHKLIFEAIVDLHVHSQPVDYITLKNKLETMGVFEQVGGMEYLATLGAFVSTAVNIKHYSDIVREKSVLRQLIKVGKSISDMGYDPKEPTDNIIEKAEKDLEKIANSRDTQDVAPINEVLESAIHRIEEAYKNKNKITGVETGFVDFDAKTAGLQPSDFILIAARPSMGKTAFALNIAQYAAVDKNVPTIVFSLEMSKEQLVNRMLCSQAFIDSQNLRTGRMEQEDWNKLAEGVGQLSEAPIFIDDKSDVTVAELRAKCRRLKKEKGLGLIVIDYLQLMNYGGRSESRQQEISSISRALKSLAREMEAPVVALSQLSRAVEQRPNHRPMLSDLRESGAIEQDADLVCFLYRDEYYNPDTEKPGQAEVIIAKQRNGSIGTVDLRWLGNYTKFTNIEREYANY